MVFIISTDTGHRLFKHYVNGDHVTEKERKEKLGNTALESVGRAQSIFFVTISTDVSALGDHCQRAIIRILIANTRLPYSLALSLFYTCCSRTNARVACQWIFMNSSWSFNCKPRKTGEYYKVYSTKEF